MRVATDPDFSNLVRQQVLSLLCTR
jgi:hypothetical protein